MNEIRAGFCQNQTYSLILENSGEQKSFSNHKTKNYKDTLELYKVKSFSDFESSKDVESFIAGTVMSVKEKKTFKGNSFAIVKFSDLSKAYELFLFSEILELNRANLIEGKSFVLTVIKDKENQENRFRRINVRKIVSLGEVTKFSYSSVEIQVRNAADLDKLYEVIKDKGDSKIKISIEDNNKNYLFELKYKRRFDHETLKYLNNEHYIKKINL